MSTAQTQGYTSQPASYPSQPVSYSTSQSGYPNQPGYTNQPGYAPQYQPQVVTQPTTFVVQQGPLPRTFCAQIAFGCFVFWCCGWLFGLIAFILAMVARDKDRSNKREEATRLGTASWVLSGVGLVLGVVILVAVIVINVTSSKKHHY